MGMGMAQGEGHVKRVNEAVEQARDGATVGSGGGGSDRCDIY